MRVLVDTLTLCVHHSASFILPGLWEISITIMHFLDSIIAKARASRQTSCSPKAKTAALSKPRSARSDDGRRLHPARTETDIRQQADDLNLDLTGIRIEDPATSQYHQRYSQQLVGVAQTQRHDAGTGRAAGAGSAVFCRPDAAGRRCRRFDCRRRLHHWRSRALGASRSSGSSRDSTRFRVSC